MQNLICTACDSCMKALDGKQGTAEVKSNYITIKGSVCLYVWNEDRSQHDFYYAQSKGDLNMLHFCNGRCFDDFMEARKAVVSESYKRQWYAD